MISTGEQKKPVRKLAAKIIKGIDCKKSVPVKTISITKNPELQTMIRILNFCLSFDMNRFPMKTPKIPPISKDVTIVVLWAFVKSKGEAIYSVAELKRE